MFGSGEPGQRRVQAAPQGEIDLCSPPCPLSSRTWPPAEVILRENPLLAVCARHPSPRESVSLADLARATVLRSPKRCRSTGQDRRHRWRGVRKAWPRSPQPGVLQLIGARTGVYPVPEKAVTTTPAGRRLPADPRRPPWEWVLAWVTAAETGRTREFTRAARDLARTGTRHREPPGLRAGVWLVSTGADRLDCSPRGLGPSHHQITVWTSWISSRLSPPVLAPATA